jgi:hypothetical protein
MLGVMEEVGRIQGKLVLSWVTPLMGLLYGTISYPIPWNDKPVL